MSSPGDHTAFLGWILAHSDVHAFLVTGSTRSCPPTSRGSAEQAPASHPPPLEPQRKTNLTIPAPVQASYPPSPRGCPRPLPPEPGPAGLKETAPRNVAKDQGARPRRATKTSLYRESANSPPPLPRRRGGRVMRFGRLPVTPTHDQPRARLGVRAVTDLRGATCQALGQRFRSGTTVRLHRRDEFRGALTRRPDDARVLVGRDVRRGHPLFEVRHLLSRAEKRFV